MQGREAPNSPSRAKKAAIAKGITEARIRKRNMKHSLAQSLMTHVFKLLVFVGA